MIKRLGMFAAALLSLVGVEAGAQYSVEAVPRYERPTPDVEAPSPLTNVLARDVVTLDGDWSYLVDPMRAALRKPTYRRDFQNDRTPPKEELIEYEWSSAPTLAVPGDWNTQDDKLFWYESVVWYNRKFTPELKDGRRYLLYFEGANYWTKVFLNGEALGVHEGGFSPFAFDVTEAVQEGENTLVVAVDSMHDETSVPSFYYDWMNYGGITRPVHLVSTPLTYVHDYRLGLRELGGVERIYGSVRVEGDAKANRAVRVEIPELQLSLSLKTDRKGDAAFDVPVENLERWSPNAPRLYDVSVAIDGGAKIADKIGFRTVSVSGQEVRLNGAPIFLKGISVHEEPIGPDGGRKMTFDDARKLLGAAKELGANFVRLSHYPHNERTLRVADELGLLVWSEIPIYWEEISYDNPHTIAVANRMYKDTINRDYNRASIAIWGVANETPISTQRNEFLKNLIDFVKSHDDTRLVSAALNRNTSEGDDTFIVDDPLGEHLDILAVNEYEGWYGERTLDEVPGVRWRTPYDKPMMFSEFGAGALKDFHGERLERFTEEHQRAFYEVTLKMAEEIPFLAGISPWILKDFRSPRRWHPRFQSYWNRKGLISETGEKKPAFETLKNWYASYDGPHAAAAEAGRPGEE